MGSMGESGMEEREEWRGRELGLCFHRRRLGNDEEATESTSTNRMHTLTNLALNF